MPPSVNQTFYTGGAIIVAMLPSAPPRIKASKHYIFYRIYVVVAILAWNFVGFWVFTRALRTSGPPVVMLFLVPIAIPAVFMCFNLAAFKFDYSMFGTLERTTSSNDPILEEVRYTGGGIAWLSATAPFLTWRVHPNGLSFHMLGVGSGYVDYSQVTGIKPQSSGCRISHSSSEVRSPLYIYDKKLCVTLSQQMAQRGIQCDMLKR